MIQGLAQLDPPLSLADHLALEEASQVRHELVGGEIYAQAGASKVHNQIALNLAAALLACARGGPCRVFASDMKLRVTEDVIYYPDVPLVCEPDEEHPLYTTRPCVVVEVLSRSTESTDRREKLLASRRLRSLRSYSLVAQDTRHVEQYWRDEHDAWWKGELFGAGHVPIPCLDVELTLDEMYEGIDPFGN